jgi:GDPmannose 4,6-dehydratase
LSPGKRALIIGCDGQDGRLLYDLLDGKGYALIGIARDRTRTNFARRKTSVNISRSRSVFELVRRFKPHEIYYLAAFHHSSQDPVTDPLELFRKSLDVQVLSLVNVLESVRRFSGSTRVFYAASSHVFGSPKARVQDETTPIAPDNVYGITKAAGLLTCRYYRERHGLFVSVGILYNHESSLRDPGFVSRKIVKGAIDIKNGRKERLILGSLAAEVDWGYAPDYVEAMHRILCHSKADDFIVASGKKHTVRDFVKLVCGRLELDWRSCVRENRDVLTKRKMTLVGSSRKLTRLTGWKPSVDFTGMVDALLAMR